MHVIKMDTLARSKGFSLIELMVAMVIGLFVAAIVASMYVSILSANSTAIKLSRLNQDLLATLDIISGDIQRAGYVSGAEAILARDSSGNPTINVASSATAIAMFNPLVDFSSSCISLRYDSNGNGLLDSASAALPEYISYRFVSASSAVQVSTDAPATGSTICGSSATNWSNLIGGDKYSTITNLLFSLNPVITASSGLTPSGAYPTTGQRYIKINVTGNNKNDSNVKLSLEREVRLQNDQFQ
jgi:prepilin-type N-terminal cleavage/methylation domain